MNGTQSVDVFEIEILLRYRGFHHASVIDLEDQEVTRGLPLFIKRWAPLRY